MSVPNLSEHLCSAAMRPQLSVRFASAVAMTSLNNLLPGDGES